jgi:hypothetical protein
MYAIVLYCAAAAAAVLYCCCALHYVYSYSSGVLSVPVNLRGTGMLFRLFTTAEARENNMDAD